VWRPYCQTHCPLNNNIPDWLRYRRRAPEGSLRDISQAYQHLPAENSCGASAPQDRLCEGNCVIEEKTNPRHGNW